MQGQATAGARRLLVTIGTLFLILPGQFSAHAADTTPPTVSNLIPAQGQLVSGTVVFEAKVYDAGGISYVDFRIDGGLLVIRATRGAQNADGSYRFYTTGRSTASWPLSNGLTHTFEVKATDTAGLVRTVTVTFNTPDTQLPTVTNITPTSNQVLGNSFMLSAQVADASTITSVTFVIDGGAVTLYPTRGSRQLADGSYYYSAPLDTATLTSGRHTLDVRAVDAANNVRVQALPYFYTSNSVPALPAHCTATTTAITCTVDFQAAFGQGTPGYKGWWAYAVINPFGGILDQRALNWNAATRAWIDPAATATKLEIPALSTAYLASAPTAPLVMNWTPPRATLAGTLTGSYTFYDGNSTCGQQVTINMVRTNPSTTLRSIAVPNGTASVYSSFSYAMGMRQELLLSVLPAPTSTAACDKVKLLNYTLRYTAPNLAPVVTKVEPGPADVQAVNEPGRGLGKLVDFDLLLHDEQPSTVTYTCRINGAALPAAQCVPTTPSRAIRRFRLFVPASATQHTITITATDSAGLAAPAAAQWLLRVSACGNGMIDPGEQCDPGLSQSCTRDTCQWSPQADRSLDCTRYDNLAATSSNDAAVAPIPTSGGVRTVYDGFSWTGNTTTLPAHYALRCQAAFTVPYSGGYQLFTKAAGGSLRIAIDEPVSATIWPGISGITSPEAEILPRRTLSGGTHTLNLIYNFYQDAATGVRPQWFMVSWTTVPDRQWVGVEIRPTTDGQPPTIGYFSPSDRQTAGSTSGTLAWNWLTDQPPFSAFYAGAFDFPQAARYEGYGTVTGGDVRFTEYYQKTDGAWDKNVVYKSTRANAWEVKNAGSRAILAEFDHERQGPAQFAVGWRLAPTVASCGNNRIDPGEQCDHGGTPTSACNSRCEVPNTPPMPACPNGVIEPPEECEPPNTSTCTSGCRLRQATPGCNNNGTCDAGETAMQCAADCGASAPRAKDVNNNPRYGDLSGSTPRLTSGLYLPEGAPLGCAGGIVVSKLELSPNLDEPIARAQTISIDGQGANSAMGDQAWCNNIGAGVHEVASSEPGGDVATQYSVCIGCRDHSPVTYQPGSRARVYVPSNSYASVRFAYGRRGVTYRRVLDGFDATVGSGAGGAAGAASAATEVPTKDSSIAKLIADRPFVVVPAATNPDGGSAQGGEATGSTARLLARWQRRPKFTITGNGQGGSYPARILQPNFGIRYPYANALNYGYVCHIPACIWGGPNCLNSQKQCLEFREDVEIAPDEVTRQIGRSLGLTETSSIDDADIVFQGSKMIIGNVGGRTGVLLVEPPSGLQGATTSIQTIPYLYTLSDVVEEGGTTYFLKQVIAEQRQNYPLQGTSVLFYNGADQSYNPPDMIEILDKEYRINMATAEEAWLTATPIGEVLQDLVTLGDDVPGVEFGRNGAAVKMGAWRLGMGIESRSVDLLDKVQTKRWIGLRFYHSENAEIKQENPWWLQ